MSFDPSRRTTYGRRVPAHGQDEAPHRSTQTPRYRTRTEPWGGWLSSDGDVVADSVGSDWSNPYDVELVDAELIGPDGEQVDCLPTPPQTTIST